MLKNFSDTNSVARCHNLVAKNLNIFNRFFLKDSIKVGLLFELQEEKSGLVTLFLYVQLSILGNQCNVTN